MPRVVGAQVEDGAPIEDSNYTVDAGQGPITGSTRYLGLAGAYTALAEGSEGVAHNPAAASVRLPYSRRRLDYDLSVDFAFAGWLPENDFLNQAERLNRGDQGDAAHVRQRSLLFGSLAATVYYRMAGFGLAAQARRQALEREQATSGLAPTSLTANYGVLHASLGYGFWDGQLVVGAGPRMTGLSVNGSGADLVSVRGMGVEVGLVVKPTSTAWRFGLAARSAVKPSAGSGSEQVDVGEGALWRPEGVTLPWEAAVGAAYQFGPRPFNPAFVSVETRARAIAEQLARNLKEQERSLRAAREVAKRRQDEASRRRVAELEARVESSQTLSEQAERRADLELRREYHARERHYLLVSAELLMIGGAEDSVALGSALSGVADRWGDNLKLSPRLGLEGELLPQRLKLRAGSYLEPAASRFSNARLHGTFGFAVKLFHWSVFGTLDEFDGFELSAAVDGAEDYLNTSLSLGFWH